MAIPEAKRKFKAANVLDPTDETEIQSAAPDQVKACFANYKAIKFGDPLVDKEPTPDQIAAMNMRVVIFRLEPYADFSVLTPYGRRVAKALRHRSWVLQDDGTYNPLEVPGPDSYDNCNACYKVYEVILFMLRYPAGEGDDDNPAKRFVVTPIALETYHEAFANLARQHLECWHLCQRAEDRYRAERFPRLARQLEDKTGKPATWSEVFVAAANDDRYWDKEVRHPAIGFLARGKRPSSLLEVAEKVVAEGAAAQGGRPPKKRPRHGRQGGQERQQGNQQQPPPPPPQRATKKPNQEHPTKDKKNRFVTTRDGQQICFKFSNGERDACPTPCPAGRAHVCQK